MAKGRTRRHNAGPQRNNAGPQRTAPPVGQADARKIDEVEQGLTALPEVPADVIDEVSPVEATPEEIEKLVGQATAGTQ